MVAYGGFNEVPLWMINRDKLVSIVSMFDDPLLKVTEALITKILLLNPF